jgi:adenylyltransferase/sulfurtransferase
LKLRRNPGCPADKCSQIHNLIDYHEFCGVPKPQLELEIEPRAVKAKLDQGEAFLLLDVRNPEEFATARIAGSRLIPLGELAARLGELDRNAEVVAHCKSGFRSMKALELLQQKGFTKVRSMKGGILAWADQVDPAVPKY